MTAAVIVGIASAVHYMLQKTDDDICAAAVSNLSGNLSLVSANADQMMEREAKNLQRIADYAATRENPEAWIRDYCTTDGMTALVFVREGDSLEDAEDALMIPVSDLDFTDGKESGGIPISKSYQNDEGQWMYAMSCPVVCDGRSVGTLYGEVIWQSIEEGIPSGLYGEDSVLLLLDGLSDYVIVRPEDTNLTEFLSCDSLDSFLTLTQVQDDFMREIFHQNRQDGQSVMFQCDVDGESHYIYMWPVNDGSAYFLGLVPTDEIMKEIPIVRHTIMFVVLSACLVSGLVIAVILIESIRRQRVRKARDEEREVHNKQLQEALDYAKAANASKTMFLSNMSHDIRTPMNAIIGFSSLLAEDPSNEEKVKAYTQKITASGHHLMNLINEILDISKIESGNVVLNIEKFSVKKLIDEIEMITRPMTETRNQKYTISMENLEYDVLLGDATRLTQIIVNLLSNASKYTYALGEISFNISCVKVSDKFERLRFVVKDSGVGMSEDYQKVIFEPFSRAENSTTSGVQGTGLGMAITKNLVDMMGGSIEICSKEGEGSTFSVEISFRVPESDDVNAYDTHLTNVVSQQNSEKIEGSLEGAHFLVVEDNVLNVELIVALLEQEGVCCDVAANGLLAVEAFKDHEPGTYDAILMDVMMPVMDGYEASRTIRGLEREDAKEIPIIAITANAFAEDINKALNAGMNAHLSKPLNSEALRKVLLPLMGHSI